MNNVIVSGYLTADIETRQAGEHQVSCFTVAVKQGERAAFLPVEAWDMPHLEQFLNKGSKVLVRGGLKQNEWETAEGERRSRLLAKAYEVEFLDPPQQSRDNRAKKSTASARPSRDARRRPPGRGNAVREVSAAYRS